MNKTIAGLASLLPSLVAAADVVSPPEAVARQATRHWPLVFLMVAGVALIIVIAARRRKAAPPQQ